MTSVYVCLSSRRRHTRCALVTGVQTCALPIYDIITNPSLNRALAVLCARLAHRGDDLAHSHTLLGTTPPTRRRRVMAWVVLIFAGLFEIGWAVGLKYTEGFTRLWPSLGTVLSMIVSLWLLGMALDRKSTRLNSSH